MIYLNDYINQYSVNSDQDKAIFEIISKISNGVIEISKLLYWHDSKTLFGKDGGEKERKKRVQDIIRSGLKYTSKQFGDDFHFRTDLK